MPSIAIIGAGPAGLTLARLLLVQIKVKNITDLKITIFEHDASATARWQQGGCLDLHKSTGIAALKAAHMWEDILPHMRYSGEELIFSDMNATHLFHIRPGNVENAVKDNQRPEVDREVLKQYLLKATQDLGGEDIVIWGKHLASVDTETGILRFRDGSETGPYDLVVGADGAWSKIRSAITDTKPSYSGISGFELWVDKEHAAERWERFTHFVGQGSFFSYSEQKSAMAQRMENGSMKLGLWVKTPNVNWASDLEQRCGDEDKLRQALLDEFSNWDTQIKMMIESSWHFRAWPLYELPIGHSWQHKQGFTLIGDSAHLMTPFAGEGVNTAMKDAMDLCHEIVGALHGQRSLDEGVQRFEQDMFIRNAQVQGKTAKNKKLWFQPDAPLEFLSEGFDLMAQEAGYDTSKGLLSLAFVPVKVLAYAYFWCVSRYGRLQRLRRGT